MLEHRVTIGFGALLVLASLARAGKFRNAAEMRFGGCHLRGHFVGIQNERDYFVKMVARIRSLSFSRKSAGVDHLM